MKKIILLLTIGICFQSCITTRVIRGEISAIDGNVVTVEGYRFKCDTTGLYVGKVVTFNGTNNKSKINSTLLKN